MCGHLRLTRRMALEIAFVAPNSRMMARQAIRDVLLRVGALTVVLALLIAVVLQRQVLRPVADLDRSIRALGEGRRGPPLPVKRHDELGDLAAAFNRMTERLDEARQAMVAEAEHALDLEQQLRRSETLAVAGKLASGIAHEVGTPLNIISGRAEMVLRRFPLIIPAARISNGSSNRSIGCRTSSGPCSMRCGSASSRCNACPSRR